MNQNLLFIIYFLSINFLCFSLGYLVNIKNQPNPFYFLYKKNHHKQSFLRKLYTRNTSDFIRINLDVSLLIQIFMLLKIEGSIVSHVVTIVCLLGLVYITYLYTFSYFFRRYLMLKADLSFIGVGLTIAKSKKYFIYLGISIILLGFYSLFYTLADNLLKLDVSLSLNLFSIFCISILGFKNIFSYEYLLYHNRVVISPSLHFFMNIIKSNRYFKMLRLEETEVLSKNIYDEFQLNDKPDIVFISVESLGSIVYKNSAIFSKIERVLTYYNKDFAAKNIHIASSFSTPPQFGGGSWLSVGSLIYGYKMENDTHYNYLFKSNSNFKYYNSIFHFCKNQGYDASMISTLGGYDKIDMDWDKIKKAYPMDTFIKIEDIAYTGKLLDFLWLHSPPDQYSLWKGMELINSSTSKPKISLFPTINSHCYWHSPLKLEEDYQELNVIEDLKTTTSTQKPLKDNYIHAIIYQLEVVFDYISKNPDKLYIIFGDHQPPFITPDSLGFETPLFILSKNQKLIDELRKEGFHNDLINLNHTIRHEGFYSLFMRSFLQVYSDSKGHLPLFPDGIKFETKIQS